MTDQLQRAVTGLQGNAARLRKEAEESEKAAEFLAGIPGIEEVPVAINAYIWVHEVYFAPTTPEEARATLRALGGRWGKTWDELVGKFRFTQQQQDASGTLWTLVIQVGPSKACQIEEREEQVTYTRRHYVPVGDCGSVLEDAPEEGARA